MDSNQLTQNNKTNKPRFLQVASRVTPKNQMSTSRGREMFSLAENFSNPRNTLPLGFFKKASKQEIPSSHGLNFNSEIKNKDAEPSNRPHKRTRSSNLLANIKMQRSQLQERKPSSSKGLTRLTPKSSSLEGLGKLIESYTPVKRSLIKKRGSQILSQNSRKTIKQQQTERSEYYELYMNSQLQVQALKQEAENERKKYERVRKIYQQKINQITQNKDVCQKKNFGHIYYFQSEYNDIVPDDVIVENSIECSIDDHRTVMKESDIDLSTLSIDSK